LKNEPLHLLTGQQAVKIQAILKLIG